MDSTGQPLVAGGLSGARATAAGWTLALLATLPTLAIAALVSILPTLFQRYGSVPGSQQFVLMILTVPSLCVAIFSPLIGAASDRWGRRAVLLPALVAFAAFGLGPFLVESLAALIATRFVVGVAEAALLAVSNALMGDYFDESQRRRWLGVQSMSGPFASVAYVLAGGHLGDWSWRGPFLLYLMGLVVLVPCLLFLPEPARRAPVAGPDAALGDSGGDAGAVFPWSVAWRTGAVTLAISLVFFVQNVQHGRIFSDLGAGSPGLISNLITVAGLVTALGGVAFRLLPTRDVRVHLAVVLGAYAVSYVGLWRAPGYLAGLPFDAIGQAAGGLAIPALIAWTLGRFPARFRGRAMGVWAGCFFLGQFLSPPLLGALGIGRLGFLASVALAGAACAVAAAVLALAARARPAANPH